MSQFEYNTAFSRNIGWVTQEEQLRLRGKRIAIAGMGGVGGFHLLTLARLGIGAFSISDFDTFDLVNFNRQAGATVSHLGRPKLEVMAQAALDINPELDLRQMPEGVTPDNLQAFLEGVDLFVDGLDFFALDIRRQVFDACQAKGIPVVTAAPLGMSASLLVFLPDSPSFESYFQLQGANEAEQALRFLVGLAPAILQRTYLADPAAVDLKNRRGPSTVMACELCAGLVATEALKLLLGRGKVLPVPWVRQFDAYRGRLVRTWRPGGNRNPLQRLILAFARWQLRSNEKRAFR